MEDLDQAFRGLEPVLTGEELGRDVPQGMVQELEISLSAMQDAVDALSSDYGCEVAS
jgi:hypothetical protein